MGENKGRGKVGRGDRIRSRDESWDEGVCCVRRVGSKVGVVYRNYL